MLPRHYDNLVGSGCRGAVIELEPSYGGLALIQRLLADAPGMVLVLRFGRAEVRDFSDPGRAARTWLAAVQPFINALSSYDTSRVYWTGQNEEAWSDENAQFEIERMRLLAAQGQKAGLFNFGVGLPDLPVWGTTKMRQVIDEMEAHGGLMCLHEYGGQDMRDGVEADGTGWYTLRYRKAWRIAGRRFPIAITECGLDKVKDLERQGVRTGPWRLISSGPDFMGGLVWYDGETQKDPEVVFDAIFVDNAQDMAPYPDGWLDHHIGPIVNSVYGHVASLRP